MNTLDLNVTRLEKQLGFSDTSARKELILSVRARLRMSPRMRALVIHNISETLAREGISLSADCAEHLTLAIDDEINDGKGHVIT